MNIYLRYDTQTRVETEQSVIATLVRKGWVQYTPAPDPAILPTFTAEQWLSSIGLGGDRQPTLLYLRLNLQAAGKSCAELNALESYLQNILAQFAADPAPRNDWPTPPITFEAVVTAAMEALQP
jgi:hypothetical protein